MAVVIIIVADVGQVLLYFSCSHCTGSMCMFLLIHCDLKMSIIFQEIFLNFLPNIKSTTLIATSATIFV